MARPATSSVTVFSGPIDRLRDRQWPHVSRRRSEEEQRGRAERLRAAGWSYRRIAGELSVSYRTVANWLDADDGRLGIAHIPVMFDDRPVAPVRTAAPARPAARVDGGSATRPAATAEALETLIEENRQLRRRVEQLVVASETQRRTLLDLESRLVETMEKQHRQLGERLLESIRTLVGRIANL